MGNHGVAMYQAGSNGAARLKTALIARQEIPMADGKIEFAFGSEEDVAYISLPDHPGRGAVAGVAVKQLRLGDLTGGYEGPDLYFDFDKENRLIGIEILA